MTEPTAAVLITLVAYKILLVGIGVVANRRTESGEDFFLGGRRLGPLVAAISASASSSSAWTLLGVSGAAYAWGVSTVWLFVACVGGFLLNWYVVAPAVQRTSRNRGAITVTEILAGPPGRRGRRTIAAVASAIIIGSLVTYIASQFQGAGKALHETFGWSVEGSILIGSSVVLLYTLLGGFWAVSLTDTLQGLVMAATSVLLPLGALAAVGGPFELATRIGEVGVDGFTSCTRSMAPAAAVGFVLGLLGIGLGYPGQPHVVNRFMALEDRPGALARARAYAVGWAVVVYAGMIVLGLAGRVLFPSLADREVIFVAATHALFPPVVAGAMLAAVLSAIMSTADSQVLVAASSFTHDLGFGGAKPAHIVRHSRWVVVALSAAAVVSALWGPTEIFGRVLFAWSAMGAAFGPLLLVTCLRGPVSTRATLGAMVLGASLSVVAYSFDATKGGAAERVLPFGVAFAIAWAGQSRRRAR